MEGGGSSAAGDQRRHETERCIEAATVTDALQLHGADYLGMVLQLMKLEKEDIPNDPIHVNYAQFEDYAALFDNLFPATSNTKVHLPDGSMQTNTHTGTITLYNNFTVTHALKNKEILAIGKRVGNLYMLDANSFEQAKQQPYYMSKLSCSV
ncbi:hypothetical protein Salat_2895800 [Sesamum alatum]|uniref:Uncharacterized protein n=1 Tax=Sesamum alatum TaxID=300844 RepID=A0AAE2C827_9LAMI|nr:hypothetical protein Salat_2895800 [Sesamum alatum]